VQRNKEISAADFAVGLIGMLAPMLWLVGLVILTDGLGTISTSLRNYVWGFGLLGANVGLGCILVTPVPENWFPYISRTLWPMHLGMLSGLYFDKETFLAEDADATVTIEQKRPIDD
jgi:hypothetical protein